MVVTVSDVRSVRAAPTARCSGAVPALTGQIADDDSHDASCGGLMTSIVDSPVWPRRSHRHHRRPARCDAG